MELHLTSAKLNTPELGHDENLCGCPSLSAISAIGVCSRTKKLCYHSISSHGDVVCLTFCSSSFNGQDMYITVTLLHVCGGRGTNGPLHGGNTQGYPDLGQKIGIMKEGRNYLPSGGEPEKSTGGDSFIAEEEEKYA